MAQSTVSNDMVIGKRRIGKDVEGSCSGEMCSPIVAFIDRQSRSKDIQCSCPRFEPDTYSIRARSVIDCRLFQSIFINCTLLERNRFSGTVPQAGQHTVIKYVNLSIRQFTNANSGVKMSVSRSTQGLGLTDVHCRWQERWVWILGRRNAPEIAT